ncbi:MAG: NAD-dependent epimerase/dehydratase family protein [Gammaproteobacteria bacterium]|nr:NAD-dependent epimerase/dehydratase family protein [Gammaproteobacteria bacterium]
MRDIIQSKRKILLTGATGFIGLALCYRLIKEDFDVRVLLRSPSKATLLPPLLIAEQVLGDLHNQQSLLEACAGVDTILHLAGVAHVSDTKGGDDTNVIGSENLLKAALEKKVRRIVFLSSTLAHAAATNSGDITSYGKGKRESELLLMEAAHKGLVEVIILRPVNVYGINMKGNIASMISMIHRGRLPRLPALTSKISLLGVEDLANAILLAANSEQTSRIYTVTDGRDYPIAAIEEAIYKSLGKRLPRWRTPAVILYAAAVLAGAAARLRGRDTGISARTYRNLTADNLFNNEDICMGLGFQPTQNLYQVLPEIVDDIVSETNSFQSR